MTKKIKSISFNTKNEKDNLVLKHISRRNFSGYVKKLILEDIQKKEEQKKVTPTNNPTNINKPILMMQSNRSSEIRK